MAIFEFYSGRPTNLEPARAHLNQIADFLTAHPEAWSRGAFARTADGSPCDPRSPEARTFCAIGLLQKFVQAEWQRICEQMLTSITGMSPAAFNDTRARTVDDVIMMFRSGANVYQLPRCGCPVCSGIDAPSLPLKFSAPAEVPDWLKLAAANDDDQLLMQVAEPVAA